MEDDGDKRKDEAEIMHAGRQNDPQTADDHSPSFADLAGTHAY